MSDNFVNNILSDLMLAIGHQMLLDDFRDLLMETTLNVSEENLIFVIMNLHQCQGQSCCPPSYNIML